MFVYELFRNQRKVVQAINKCSTGFHNDPSEIFSHVFAVLASS